MMTMTCNQPRARSPFAIVLASTLGLTACDLGPKSVGLQPDTDDGADENGDSDTGDTDEGTDSTDDGMNDPDIGLCGEETESIITDLSTIPPGFESSVADLLAQEVGDYQGTFSWNENDGPVMVEHAGTSSPLTMAVAHVGGEIRLTEVEFVGEFPNGNEGGEPCSNHLEIDVELEFVTEDGLFAESMTVPLDAYSHSESPSPRLYLDLDFDTHMGSLQMDDFSFTDGVVEVLILTAEFTAEQSHGGLSMQVLIMDWVGFGGVASFTADRVDAP
jgi:hypothetical protein